MRMMLSDELVFPSSKYRCSEMRISEMNILHYGAKDARVHMSPCSYPNSVLTICKFVFTSDCSLRPLLKHQPSPPNSKLVRRRVALFWRTKVRWSVCLLPDSNL